MRFIIGVGILILLMACGREQETTSVGDQQPEPADTAAVYLKGISLPLKDAPDENATNIRRLEEGEKVFLTGEQSTNTTTIKWKGTTYKEPWLLVRTEKQEEGWVHGLIVYLAEDSIIYQKQYWQMLFGTTIAQEMDSFADQYANAQTTASLLAAFNEAQDLTQAMEQQIVTQNLQEKVAVYLDDLQGAVPTVFPYTDEEEFALFLDFKQWHAKAIATDNACDDHLFEFYFKLYPIDSIEYLCPVWSLEVAKGAVYNLLGDSIHYRLLEDLDQWPDCEGLLAAEKGRIKKAIINDLIKVNVLYWNKRDKVLAEMAKIVKAPFACLTAQDQLLIQQRLDELLQDEEGTVHLFNYRSGK